MKLLLYCAKNKPYLVKKEINYIDSKRKEVKYLIGNKFAYDNWINNKIVAECDYEIEEIFYDLYGDLDWQHDYLPTTKSMSICNLENYSCLNRDEIENCLEGKNGKAIHIKNLHIFDEPKGLINYKGELVKAPQNMMYVFDDNEKKVLISVKPELLCKILNGECTIIVKKKVLKEMI